MKYVVQFTIFVSICFIGEILHILLPLPVPASIYGLILMFCALHFKIFKLEHVEHTADFFLGIMPLLFIPSTVSLIVAWPIIKKHWIAILLLMFVGTAFIFFVVGTVTQFFARMMKKRQSAKKLQENA